MAAAVATGFADLPWPAIIGVMAAAWALVAVIELRLRRREEAQARRSAES